MQQRKWALAAFALGAILSVWSLFSLRFSFDFEQFFPDGDPDWAFFKEFKKDFESDDNFLLIAVERKNGVFDSAFLAKFHDLTLKSADLPHVRSSQSLTKIGYPIQTPFSISFSPAIHFDQPEFFDSDRKRVLEDPRFVHNLISEDATALTIFLKTKEKPTLEESRKMMAEAQKLTDGYGFEAVHFLGTPNFSVEIVEMERREITVMTLAAAVLAALVLWFIFRRFWGVALCLAAIGLALLFFLASLAVLGRELNALAALYPILMCIVGTADSIHLMSKYVDELEKGRSREEAMRSTIREIGLATFLTCITTALGFASLLTNRTLPIRDFGVNAAIGVIVAFLVIFAFFWAVLPFFRTDQLIKFTREYAFWGRSMEQLFWWTKKKARLISLAAVVLLVVSLVGIWRIGFDYNIRQNLPRGTKITADFLFFEKAMSGFRPLNFAVFAENGRRADDFEVQKEIEKVEKRLAQFGPIKSIASPTDLFKTINRMRSGNRIEGYALPDSLADFETMRPVAARVPSSFSDVLMSKDGAKARISARMQDVGRDSVQRILAATEKFIATEIDSSVATFRATGTGLILDKNSTYIRDNMLQGLVPSVLLVALLMAFLFKNGRLILIFLVPNVFPLFFAGALLGYFGIPLEAGVSTVFSIVFGIATDDTIHFLSAFKLARDRGDDVETALRTTMMETGKAMCLTSIILFFSFSVMLFSIHPPSLTVGLLVSATLAGALFCDLLLVPVLIRRLLK